MERLVKIHESDIVSLTQQSIVIALQLNKVEPSLKSHLMLKSCIRDTENKNENVRSSLDEAGKGIEKLQSRKEQLETQNED